MPRGVGSAEMVMAVISGIYGENPNLLPPCAFAGNYSDRLIAKVLPLPDEKADGIERRDNSAGMGLSWRDVRHPRRGISLSEVHVAKTYPIEEALKAQKALRDAAGLKAEQFPVEAFVGMVSDEIEELRKRGKSDEDIARLVGEASAIQLTAAQIGANYAPPEEREGHGKPR